MNRPILLQVTSVSQAVCACRRFQEESGLRLAGIEYVAASYATATAPDSADTAAVGPRKCDPSAEFPIRVVATACRETQVDLALDEVKAALMQASFLEAQVINLSLPPLSLSRDRPGFARYRDALNFAYELLREVRLDAEAAGVAVAVEAAQGGCLLSPVELRELIDAVNSCAVGVCIDDDRIRNLGSTADWITTLTHRTKAIRRGVPNFAEGTSAAMENPFCVEDDVNNALSMIAYVGPVIVAGATGHRLQDVAHPVS